MWARKFGPCIVWARLCGPGCCVGQAMRPWIVHSYLSLPDQFLPTGLSWPQPSSVETSSSFLRGSSPVLCRLASSSSSPLRAPSRGPQMVRWVRSQMERIGAAFSRGGQSTLILHTVCCVLAVLCCTFLVTQTITSVLSSVASAFLAPCSLSC